MYILIAVIGFLILAVVSIMDKFILSKQVASPSIYTFLNAIATLPIFLFVFLGVNWPATSASWLAIFISGVAFCIGLWFLFKGINESEVSHIGPLVGAAVPFFTVIFSRLFLGEILSDRQFLAIGLLVLGSLIISFENSADHHGWHRGMVWGVLSGMAYAASHTASKYAYDSLGFFSGLVLSRSVLGLCGLLLLILPSIRRHLFETKEKNGRKKRIFILVNLLLAFVSIILVQYAISLGSVSVVNSLESIRYGFLIILVAIFSKFFPKLFKEDYSRGEMVQEAAAVAIIASGLLLLV